MYLQLTDEELELLKSAVPKSLGAFGQSILDKITAAESLFNDPRRELFVQAAKRNFQRDEIEFDDSALVSFSDKDMEADGAFVMAWHWVDNKLANVDEMGRLLPNANMERFFVVEINNELHGGVSPATLKSAKESALQAPDSTLVEWYGSNHVTIGDDSLANVIRKQIDRLIADFGEDTELRILIDA